MAKQQAEVKEINAALLARVSGEAQRDNSSHESQLGRCRAYCADHGYTIVTERKEVFSGAFVLARSDFNDLLEMGAAGEIEVIVVDIPDRLGRGDVIAKCELLAQLNNCRIEYATKGHDVTTPEGMANHAVQQMVSGFERLNIKRRTSDGKLKFAKEGRVIAPPRRPYGYTIINSYDERNRKTGCTLEIVESEAAVIRSIYEMCATEALTTQQIAKRLTLDGVPRISSYDSAHSATRQAAQAKRNQWDNWPRATVASILNNTLYKGEWQYGRRKVTQMDSVGGIKTKTVHRDADEVISVPVPAIVTEEVWQLAQARLHANMRKFARPTNKIYLLRKRMRCALCGGFYYCITTGRGPRYYNCGRHNYNPLAEHCPAGSISADRIEAIVWKVVCEELQHPERMLGGARKRQEDFARERRILEQSLPALAALDAKDQGRAERLLDLFTGGDLKKDHYLLKKAEVDAILEKRQKEREDLLERMQDIPIVSPELEEVLHHFGEEIGSRLGPEVAIERKLALLDVLAVECVYDATAEELNISGLFGSRLVSTTST